MLANSFEQKLAMKDKSVFEIKMCTRRCGRGSYKNFMEKTCTRVLYLLHSKFKLCGKSVDTKRGASGFPLLSLFSPRTPHTWREKGEPFNHLHAHGVRQSLSGEVPDQQAIITSFLLDENYSMKDRKVE